GQVKPNNIRHTHFSRNPKIAAFLKAYHFVKEFGEGFDRICREQEANGANTPSFRTDEFILKITVPKVNERLPEKLPENADRTEKLPENIDKLTEKLTEKAKALGERLTENKIAILRLMVEDPYISKSSIAELVGISYTAVGSNIKAMRGKYLRRVGPDKGGFWEIIG
ncbi:MAG: winged helix-turn-helix transcriptional regulator, partial [Prevotella sp.]|nr:winged helix-turn-helix transcriptional regulator [Prevotella sp.]